MIKDFKRETLKTVYKCHKDFNGKDIVPPAQMSEQELYDGYVWIYRQIYSVKNILKRMPEAKSQRTAYLLLNFLYRRYGRFTDLVCKMITYQNVGIIAEKLSRYL